MLKFKSDGFLEVTDQEQFNNYVNFTNKHFKNFPYPLPLKLMKCLDILCMYYSYQKSYNILRSLFWTTSDNYQLFENNIEELLKPYILNKL